MTRTKRNLLYGATLILVGLIIGLGISSNLNLLSNAYTQDTNISKEAIDILSKTGQAMAEVAAAVKPAVVNISSTKTIKISGMQSPFFDDPFFRRFFGDQFGQFERPREHKQSGLGSGVIVDKDGYILTNNHVIRDADEIKVKLSDKREFKGKVIGTDPKTDLAVIKIDSNHLPVLKLGDSDKLKVGETVIAIGNPFGLNQTVTSGIVSATGRANVGIADYEDFIQTDAPINPGNSGGALVNVRGELVGINTAIFSTSGGYQGIGFAIPSSMAKVVMDNLIKKGKVVRGWLGVSIQPVTSDLAKQFDIKDDKGALVGDVVEESPAEKAGMQRGDVIIEFDGKEVPDPASLRNSVAGTPPGKKVTLKIMRDGKMQKMDVAIAELPADMQKMRGEYDNLLKGVMVQGLTPELKRNLDVPKRISGVVVTDIEEGSPAGGLLIQNDVIIEVNRKRINSMKDYEAVVSKIKSGQDILLLVFRNGSTTYLSLSAR
ncbi:MAG: DegQ family serine endoprotease [Nitrospirae bacterium]|nr:DegQ family serine endoprotease [Nitrospirota bacterium]